MTKMNILMLFPWLSLGGGQKTTISLAKGLRQRGHKVIYASQTGILLDKLKQEGIEHCHLPFNRLAPELLQISAGSIIKLVKLIREEQIDIIHSYHPYSFLISYIASIFCDVPIINTHLHTAQGLPIPWFKGKVICVAQEFKDASLPRYKSAEEIIVIRNRIDLEEYYPRINTDQFKKQFNLRKDSHRIVMISRIVRGKHKAILHLLDAIEDIVKEIPDLEVLIAGDGDYFKEIEKKANEINVKMGKKSIAMTGGVMQVHQLLNSADISLGIGRCAWEAMACGKPTIIVGENGFAGVVEPSVVNTLAYYNFSGRNAKTPVEPKLLADATVRILKDREYAKELGKFSRKYVIEELDSKLGAEKLEGVYYDVLGNYKLNLLSKVRALSSIIWILFGLILRTTLGIIIKKRVGW